MSNKDNEVFTEREVLFVFSALALVTLAVILLTNLPDATGIWDRLTTADGGITLYAILIIITLSVMSFYWSPTGKKTGKKAKQGFMDFRQRLTWAGFGGGMTILLSYVWVVVYAGGLFVIGRWIYLKANQFAQIMLAVIVIGYLLFEVYLNNKNKPYRR